LHFCGNARHLIGKIIPSRRRNFFPRGRKILTVTNEKSGFQKEFSDFAERFPQLVITGKNRMLFQLDQSIIPFMPYTV